MLKKHFLFISMLETLQFCCMYGNSDIVFQDSLMNIKFKRTAFICNIKCIICSIIKMSFLFTVINFFFLNHTDPKLLNASVYDLYINVENVFII